MISLFMALFWLILGGAMLVWHWQNPNAWGGNMLGTGISAGWLAVLLAFYNLVRWWSVRSYMAQMRELAEIQRQREYRPRPVAEERNPAFDFSDKPGKESDGPRGTRS